LCAFVDDRLQYHERVRRLELWLAVGAKRVRAAGIELDVIDALLDVLADGRATFLDRTDDDGLSAGWARRSAAGRPTRCRAPTPGSGGHRARRR
jgi:hypothetical protein